MLFAKEIEVETLSSRLVSDLFDLKKLEDGRVIKVLDLGAANGNTFNFLSQFNCRLQVIDIKNKLLSLAEAIAEESEERERGLETAEIRERLIDAFEFEGSEQFDVCLIWDFLNYLDPSSMPVFAELLLPHLTPKAKIHGFAVLNRSTPLTEQSYGVVDTELLSITGQKNIELPHRHSQSAITDYLRGVSVKQSILRADGRLEMILQAVQPAA